MGTALTPSLFHTAFVMTENHNQLTLLKAHFGSLLFCCYLSWNQAALMQLLGTAFVYSTWGCITYVTRSAHDMTRPQIASVHKNHCLSTGNGGQTTASLDGFNMEVFLLLDRKTSLKHPHSIMVLHAPVIKTFIF